MSRNRLTLSLLAITAALSVNAHADGVCSPEPRGNPALCQEFVDAMETLRRVQVPPGQTLRQPMIDLGLIGPDGNGPGWLTAKVEAWNRQKQQEANQFAIDQNMEDLKERAAIARQERQTRALENQADAIGRLSRHR